MNGYSLLFEKLSSSASKVQNDKSVCDLEYKFATEAERNEMLDKMVNALPEEERVVIRQYYGLDTNKKATLQTVANELNCTRQWVYLIYSKAINRLSSPSFYQMLLKEQISINTIEQLELSKRAYNCLRYVNIRTVKELIYTIKNDEKKLWEIPGCGKAVMNEYYRKIAFL